MKLPGVLTTVGARIAALCTRIYRSHPRIARVCDIVLSNGQDLRLFAGVLLACLVVINVIATTGLHWHVLDARFRADAEHQAQAFFLPVRPRQVKLAIVGDSLFHASIPAELASQEGVERVVINRYDGDDLEDFLTAVIIAHRRLKTEVCHILSQASPVFMVRAKVQGKRQNDDFIRLQARQKWTAFDRGAKNVFGAIETWASLTPGLEPMQADHGRLGVLIGQARMADPGRENWSATMRRFSYWDGGITLVDDRRVTDLGPESNLPAAFDAAIRDAEQDPELDLTRIALADLKAFQPPACDAP